MPIFALDTATPSPSLALLAESAAPGADPLAELWLAPEPGSGRRVMEAAHHLLGAAGVGVRDLTRVVVGLGPGGFTGLRIGIATALGLGQALRVPVEGASSLEALALGISDVAGAGGGVSPLVAPVLVAPVLDARRGEVFGAAYRPRGDGRLDELIPPVAIAPAALAALLRELGAPVLVGGDGLDRYRDELRGVGVGALAPGAPGHRLRASDLVRRIVADGPRPVRPQYARLPDAEVNRRRALAAARA